MINDTNLIFFNASIDKPSLYTSAGLFSVLSNSSKHLALHDKALVSEQSRLFTLDIEACLLMYCKWPFGYDDAMDAVSADFLKYTDDIIKALQSPVEKRKTYLFITLENMRLDVDDNLRRLVRTNDATMNALIKHAADIVHRHTYALLAIIGDTFAFDCDSSSLLTSHRASH